MIPENIRKDHVLRALEEIDEKGVPKRRASKKFELIYEGSSYPPKYAISLANKFANNRKLEPLEFGGGKETNEFLRRLGFKVRRKQQV